MLKKCKKKKNIIISEPFRLIKFKLYRKHLGTIKNAVFHGNSSSTLVALKLPLTYDGKIEKCIHCFVTADVKTKLLQKCF